MFDESSLQKSIREYATSTPYKHGIICPLVNDQLLRSVRSEIQENVHFTPKETDIYKIHQSGDLANLDGLDDGALEKLPSLLRLRDVLYSSSFRKYISTITGSGPLSGRKTDMAINLYTPGCHLLCHDDVIGSRRVSYILYLTDPDIPWKKDWGGALRLFPTITFDEDGEKVVTPCPDPQVNIPPAWNQLSFFAVQPGESFHDVEEVYHAATKEQLRKDAGRIRMAISGWFHIPQRDEEGYIDGEEEKWGKNSSLKQLQGDPDRYDLPKPQLSIYGTAMDANDEPGLSESDLDFLLKYIAPTYLTPDTLNSVAKKFVDLSCVTLNSVLSQKFASRIRQYLESEEKIRHSHDCDDSEKSTYNVARPPHKHRYLFLQPDSLSLSCENTTEAENPIKELLTQLLPSPKFRKWLELATECKIESFDLLARRFRRGSDYTLAKNHEGKPQLEISLGLTPTHGWGDSIDEIDKEDKGHSALGPGFNSENPRTMSREVPFPEEAKESNGFSEFIKENFHNEHELEEKTENFSPQDAEIGGYEVYMVGDDNEAEDAAIYKESLYPDDNILFTIPASWNKMSIVLRDKGVMKFVKYVSRNAPGDRWDISGAYGVRDMEHEESINDSEGEYDANTLKPHESRHEEEFNGFSDSECSNSE